MILLPLVSLIILPILARAQVGPVPTNTPINIVDFQKNVFDLASAKPNAPVQGLNHRVGDPAQQWVIHAVGGQVFQIVNPTAGTFFSYSTAAIGGDPVCSQLFGESDIPTQWIISPGNTGFQIIENSSKRIVTSWPRLKTNSTDLGSSTPLTLQPFYDVPEQLFTFQPYSSGHIALPDHTSSKRKILKIVTSRKTSSENCFFLLAYHTLYMSTLQLHLGDGKTSQPRHTTILHAITTGNEWFRAPKDVFQHIHRPGMSQKAFVEDKAI
ncbi:hypothetical protein C8J57DRAFT_1492174 [Mycena rebaudengoi]|nr:hypothetical protein C8J57DRAFT_1492174 [Mycena rebaudengoi]